MAHKRFRLKRKGYYHCMSKTLNGEFLLGDVEKEKFVELMRSMEAFAGVTIITFVVMCNHFHILLAENERIELSDEEMLARLRAFYGPRSETYLVAELYLRGLQEHELHGAIAEFHERYQQRMNNVSEFMKTLKQRFTQWYNKRNERSGTVWNQRFKSVVVQSRGSKALSHMAAYIDLNPLRAHMVKDPKGYRWSGYGEAVAGVARARAGFERLYTADGSLALGSGKLDEARWQKIGKSYRMLIYERGVAKSDRYGNAVRAGFSREEIMAVLDCGGSLPWDGLAKCRVKYFTQGVMIGAADFIDLHEERIRKHLGLKRKRMAKQVREFAVELHVFRRYWKCQVSPPAPPD